MFRKLIASAALAASVIVVAPGIANAAINRPVTYQLTQTERSYACGSFVGTIIFQDSSSIDCSTGIATYSLAF